MTDQTFTYRDDDLTMDGVSLAAIAAATGTPVYVYSLARVLAQHARLAAAFRALQPDFHFSLKSNTCRPLVSALVTRGCGCDVVSAGEIFLSNRRVVLPCTGGRLVFCSGRSSPALTTSQPASRASPAR